MVKTKLGVSVGLLAAGIYFIGLIAMTPLLLAAGYVIIMEEDAWLRKSAIRAVVIVVSFAVLSTFLGLLDNSTTLITNIVQLFRISASTADIDRVIRILQMILNISERVVLLVMGFVALRQGMVRLAPVDNLMDNHM
ncbi:MAG: hypothetical protein FWC71_05180 [Defluviitaleaceae bacterium]|nr:hypothetical protein [Defluviitaleaceae bacterium]